MKLHRSPFSAPFFAAVVASAGLVFTGAAAQPAPSNVAAQPAALTGGSPTLYQDMRWRFIGPFRGGRTVAAAGIPEAPSVAYVGAVDGGVWRTTDFGQTWSPVFEGQSTQSIGAIAIAPSNSDVIYVGSGEGLRRPDLSTGDGMYKSTDGGQTWTHLGLRDSQQIGAIAVDPKDPNRVFVAALGHPYGPNEERGVFRSTDGGATFQKVLYKNADTGAIDLALDPSDSKTIYAVLWSSRRSPWHMGGEIKVAGSGLFVSHDGGDTWQQLTTGLPTGKQGLGRIGIAIAPSDPRRMYAWVEADDRYGGIYRSDDSGVSWTRVNAEQRIWGRGDDFACVRVDPTDVNRIYVANTSTYVSQDGGATFAALKGAPGGDDYHTVWINPLRPQIILLASDQGATMTVNGGATWSSWYNQPTAQLYHVSTDNRFPYWVYGGQQESGSAAVASRSDFGEITFRDWHPVGVEEWGYVAPDPLDPNVIYGGKATRYDQRTGQLQDISPGQPGDSTTYRYDRTAPLAFSPVDPHALFLAANVMFETTDGGHRWRIVSPDLTRAKPPIPPNLGVFAPATAPRGVIYSFALSYRDPRVIWAGTDDGLIWRTADGGAHWSDVTPGGVSAWSKVRILEASRFDDRTAYAAISRFVLDDLHPYIYKTHDGGKTWTKIVAGLPDDVPVNSVREDPERKGLLFASTERSVFVSFDDGTAWLPLGLNLPATSVRDLTIHGDDLVAGTHGRGFWILDDITPLRQVQAHSVDAGAPFLFKPQLTYRLRRDNNTDTPLPPEVPAGQNPPDGAIIDYYLPSRAFGILSIDILNARGHTVRRYESTDRPPLFLKDLNVPTYWIRSPRAPSVMPGMHRWVWNLRWTPPDAIDHSYPISAIYHDTPPEPAGPMAAPGRYSVRLTVNGRSYTQPLVVRADPRLSTSPSDYAAQFALAQDIAALMNRDYAAWEGAVSKKTQNADALAEINGDLSALLVAVDGADRRPTIQQQVAAARIRARLEKLLH